ncbi:hypothetical protein [Rhizobium leguminosarum]|uniref:hypothetical protein n=1 Tax=Rhizobium leguminosarum TaxID=384 RepID=UPI00103F0C56|nr:hypothetical protein [Rhizobium leguminosarum]TBZ21004.1 hypothetical protein E0H33_00425 [Rhizobium leguminosarum bv. viciae]
MRDEFVELVSQLEEIKAKIDPVLLRLAEARRAHLKEPTVASRATLDTAQEQATELHIEYSRLVALLPAATGLPPEELELLVEESRSDRTGENRLLRETLTTDEIVPTAEIDDYLADALERVKSILPSGWLEEQPEEVARIDALAGQDAYLSLTKGVRPESATHSLHRLRQAIYVSQDYLNNEPFYDQFAGALLVPALTRLALQGSNLKHVGGERDERLDHLWKGPSQQVDATLFELLTAAACAEMGRSVEFISATSEKSPDIRCHDPYPLVIECKRQDPISQYEAREEELMRQLFLSLRAASHKRGLHGTFHLELSVEASTLDPEDVVQRLISQRLVPDPSRKLAYPWGAVAFLPRLGRVPLPGSTRIYSPNMLEFLFGWNSDLPTWDGICCSIEAKGEPFIDEAREPIALLWRNDAENALKKRSWAPLNLFGKASFQIPPGEFGIIYVNYVEGARAKVANMRQAAFAEKLQAFEHSAKVRIPISLLVRLYPRPLDHGQPDLIESNVRYLSAEYGDAELFDLFPTTIYTHQSEPG